MFRFAVGEASVGLNSIALITTQSDARSAVVYMKSTGIMDPLSVTRNSIQKRPTLNQAQPGPAAAIGKPVRAVLRLSRNQAEVSTLHASTLINRSGKAVGTIADLVIDAERHAISFAHVQTIGPNSRLVAIKWSALRLLSSNAKSQYFSPLTESQLARIGGLVGVQDEKPSDIEVEHNLIGRFVVSADGETVGKLTDVVVELNSGTVDYVLVSPIPAASGNTKTVLALPWAAIADLKVEQDIILASDQKQLADAPRFPSR
jgi:sporulation protein YlmC with PRC-barrel domain